MKIPTFGLSGYWPYLIYGLAALALVAAIVGGVRSCKKIDQQEQNKVFNSGVEHEQVQGQSEIINAVTNAQNVVRNPTSEQLNVVCSKYDRNCPHGS